MSSASDLNTLPLELWAEGGKCYYKRPGRWGSRASRYYEVTLNPPAIWRVYARDKRRMHQVHLYRCDPNVVANYIRANHLQPILPKWMQMDIGL